jgi:hypothetical protein
VRLFELTGQYLSFEGSMENVRPVMGRRVGTEDVGFLKQRAIFQKWGDWECNVLRKGVHFVFRNR